MKKALIFIWILLSICTLMGCQKEFTEALQTKPTSEFQPSFTVDEAKDFLKKSNGPFAKPTIFMDFLQRNEEMKLFWEISNDFSKRGLTHMEVPFSNTSNSLFFPVQTILFWKDEKGIMNARFKYYQNATVNNKIDYSILLESIFDLDGKHIQTIAHHKGKMKNIRLNTALEARPMALNNCTEGRLLVPKVDCVVNGEEFSITCKIRYEYFYFSYCPDGAPPVIDENIGGGESGYEGDSEGFEPEPEAENDNIVDIQRILDCYNNIPNEGATYSVRLLVDIPIDKMTMVPFG